jgi:hypothetical protein
VVLLRMASRPRPRSWWLTCPTISAKTRYALP